jgi:hypothetical protein
MSTVELKAALRQLETDQERVLLWRRDRLETAGYSGRLALKLALNPSIDLHDAVMLIERGCPPDTAARILQ